MTFFVYTQRDMDAAIEATIEETLRAVVLKIMGNSVPLVRHDPLPWLTARNEAVGAATRINLPELRDKIKERLEG